MAIGTGFKQTCPSCEALVPVKDADMIGKKIDCPKCKYRFVVEDPVERDKKAVKGEGKSKSNGSVKPPKVDEVEDLEEADDEVEDLEEVEEKKPAKKTEAKKTEVKAKPKDKPAVKKAPPKKVRDAEDDDEEEQEESPKKKKKGKKSPLGLILAGVGLVAIAVAAFFILRGGKNDTKETPPAPGSNEVAKGPEENPPGEQPPGEPGAEPGAEPGEPKTKPTKKKAGKQRTQTVLNVGNGPGPELTNLLPNDTEHVFHVFFKELLEDENATLRKLAFDTPGMFLDGLLQKRLGFSVLAIDDLIRAEKYSSSPWSFTVLHFSKPLDEPAIVEALGLKPAPATGKMPYYQATKDNPYLDQFGRIAIGSPSYLRLLQPQTRRPLFVRIHNPQTLILADQAPMIAFAKADGQFKYLSDKFVPPPPMPDPNQPDPNQPPSEPPPPGGGNGGAQKPGGLRPVGDGTPGSKAGEQNPEGGAEGKGSQPAMPKFVGLDTYMTIKPRLKEILDRMEGKDNPKHKVLFSSATEMNSARINTAKIPEYRDRVLWKPRLAWDVTYILSETKPRIAHLGTSLLQRDQWGFGVRNELTCVSEVEAKALTKELKENTSADIARFFLVFLGHKVELPKKDMPMVDPNDPNQLGAPPPPGENPNPQNPQNPLNPDDPNAMVVPPDPQASAIGVAQNGKWVNFNMDFVLDGTSFTRLYGMGELIASNVKNEVEMAIAVGPHHLLAKAGKELGAQGLTDRGMVPGQYPPGAFKRPAGSLRTALLPNHRISWMAGLLPYLGQEALYRRVDFDSSWKDPSNWMLARTIVPEFLDPMYPDRSRFIYYPDSGLEAAATHYVGLAGVGLDAADYDPADPAVAHKVGILGYNRSASVAEIRAGRGLSNTALMIQVPHDGAAGTTPWVAGGGATLRGVPEKNSIQPFVLTTDRNGKQIMHAGKRGTNVLMADGSVRWVSAEVPDDVFKAMVTVKGPAPDGFDSSVNEWAPVVPDTAKREKIELPPQKPATSAPATPPKTVAKPKPVSLKPAPAGTYPPMLQEAVTIITGALEAITQATDADSAQTAAKQLRDQAAKLDQLTKKIQATGSPDPADRTAAAELGKEVQGLGQQFATEMKAFTGRVPSFNLTPAQASNLQQALLAFGRAATEFGRACLAKGL